MSYRLSPPYLKQKVLGKLADGYSYRAIAAMYHVSDTTVSRIAQRHGFGHGTVGRPPREPKKGDSGAPFCSVCQQAFWYTSDLQYGATLQICRCGSSILSPGFAA